MRPKCRSQKAHANGSLAAIETRFTAFAAGDLETGLEAGRGVQNTDVSLVAQGDPAFMGNLINSNSSIVVNSFGIPDWKPEATEVLTENCTSWCTAMRT